MVWWRNKRVAHRPAPEAFELKAFKRELAGVPAGSPFWVQLLALLDAYVLTEAAAVASPSLDDAEAHRLRGRIGMLLDLKADLERLRHEAMTEMKRGK